MTATAVELRWQDPGSAAESEDLASSLAGPNGLELVVEMAHDLRSPLTSILFLAESLRSGQSSPVTDSQRRQLGLIYSAALCLCTAANDVLEVARGGDRLADKEPGPFSIVEVFKSVRDMVQPIAEEKGLPLHLKPARPDWRLGHARALSRVLLNLTTNALKFTEQGFVELTARALDATRVEFSVRDTGPGIDAAAQGAVPPVPQAPVGAAAALLELRPRTRHVPQARHGDGFRAPRRNTGGLGYAVFLRTQPARDEPRRLTRAASRPSHSRRRAAM